MKKFLGSLAAILLIAGTASAQAQDAPPPPDSQQASTTDVSLKLDPGVARVSLAEGDVSTQRGDNGEWVAATVNSPISVDDRVSTGDRSRAELQLDWADILRMSEHATTRIVNISRTQIQVQVGQGLVTYNVLKGSEAASEIDTPNAAIHPASGEGEYRIVVVSDSETRVIVRRGSADISTSAGTTRVEQGQMITIAGTDNPQYQATRAPDRDDWDGWNNERNHRIRSAESWGKTNRYYTGSEDLDQHGIWTEVPDYGQVWTPNAAPGWAPYRAGRWVWEPYYGWTWVSYEPWGWAPYHYGRWFVYGGNWVWWPGPVAGYPGYYPVWSPAYVSFFGFGGRGFGVGFGVGFGFGTVGWLAIGPGDWFHPWWGRWGGREGNFGFNEFGRGGFGHDGFGPLAGNRAHQFSNLSEAGTNSRVRGGMSSMAGSQFGRGAVPTHQSAISAASLRGSSVLTGKSPMTPGRGSYSATDRSPGASSVRNSTSSSQRFYSSSRANTRTNASASASTSGAHSTASKPTGSASASNGSRSVESPHGNTNSSNAARGNSTPRSSAAPTTHAGNSAPSAQSGQNARGGWQHFAPPTSSQPRTTAPNQQQRSTQSSPYGRSPYGQSPYGRSPYGQSPYGSRGSAPNTYNRPPLNMNRPIVTPRNGSNRAPNTGARGTAPNGASRGATGGSTPHGSSGGSSHGGGSSHSGGRH